MISNKLFTPLLILALVLVLLQLLSGIWLFAEKFGLNPSEVYVYYAGNKEAYILPKSFEGLLETAVPHLIAVSTTIFVYAHFLLFTQVISDDKKLMLILSLFISAMANIFSPFGMLYGYEIFAWLKVLAFWSFEGLMGLLLYLLFLAGLKEEKA